MDTQLAGDAGKVSKRILVGVIAGVVILIVGVVTWNVTQVGNINSFADCATKYPVIELYPEQCRTPDGRIFTKQY